MNRTGRIAGGRAVSLLLALILTSIACSADSAPEPTLAVASTLPPTPAPTATAPSLPTQPEAMPTTSPLPTARLSPTPEPVAATSPPFSDSWYREGGLVLIVSGDDTQADLMALERDGTSRPLFANVGNEPTVSEDGQWLGFIRWRDDGQATLELHQSPSSETRQITPDSASGLLRFVFDPQGRRLIYLELGPPSDSGTQWALVLVDLETGASARYESNLVDNETRPLPGVPVGWSGAPSAADELIIDTFLPYTEGGSMGMWGVTLPPDGASAPLDTLPLRELIPGAPVYTSRLYLSPDRERAAYLGRDPDYQPDDYFPEFYDLAVNRLGAAMLEDGARSTWVEATDGSALARALAWSPTEDRLLFAQGRYEGEEFAELALKSTDQSGAVVSYGPLDLPGSGGLLQLAWCDPSLALYLTWDGSDGTQRLLGFDLNTGRSTELAAAARLEIVGCVPR